MFERAIIVIVGIALLTSCVDSDRLRSAFGSPSDNSTERPAGR
jgi:hypothetical protein